MSYFIHYWTGGTFELHRGRAEREGDTELDHTAGNLFVSRGVGPGDTVYVVNFHKGELYVVTRLVVDRIVNRTEAERILGTNDLWDAREHVIGRKGGSTLMRFDAVLPPAELPQIEFVVADGSIRPPATNQHGASTPRHFAAFARSPGTRRTHSRGAWRRSPRGPGLQRLWAGTNL